MNAPHQLLLRLLLGVLLLQPFVASLRRFSRTCPLVTIAHGQSRMRSNGRLVRFNCEPDYVLHGNMYVDCRLGKWQSELPMCLKPGCPELEQPANGMLSLSSDRTSLTLFCHAQHAVAGAATAYCDGTAWDRSLGNCRVQPESPATWCDFDTDTCGWTADAGPQNYDWRRENGVPPSGHPLAGRSPSGSGVWRTGPLHDHTVGVPLEGFYMVAQPTDTQVQHELARLVSPLYPANGGNGCLRLSYHMYGRSVGRLRVYVKPLDVSLVAMLVDWDSRFVLFERMGNQGNEWQQALVRVPQQGTEYQLVVEASAGGTRMADIAIDDVALLEGADCRQLYGASDADAETTTADTQTEEPGGVFDVGSCAGRCNRSGDDRPEQALQNGGVFLSCDCNDECFESSSCCIDYSSECVFAEDIPQLDAFVKNNVTTPTTVAATTPASTSTTHPATTTSTSTSTSTTTTTTTSTTTTTARPSTPTTSTTTTTPPPRSTTGFRTPTAITKSTKTTTSAVRTTKLATPYPISPTRAAKLQQFTQLSTSKPQAATNRVATDAELTTEVNRTKDNYVWRSSEETTVHTKNQSLSWGIVAGVLLVVVCIGLVVSWKLNLLHRPIKQMDKEFSDVRYLVEDDGQLDFEDKTTEIGKADTK